MKSFAHQTSLTRHIEVHAPRQESETSYIYIYMLGGGSTLPLSAISLPTVCFWFIIWFDYQETLDKHNVR
jgi:hypothetical protein